MPTANDVQPTDKSSPLSLRVAGIVCLLGAIALVYAPAAGFAFVNWDDDQYIVENPHVLGGLSWSGVRWAFTTTHVANWHPLTWLSHQLDVSMFGPRPGPPHVENVAWHMLNTLLVLQVLRRLGSSFGFALGMAALFAMHPLRVESVAWVAERKDVLSAAAGLCAVLAYLRYVESPSRLRMAVVAAWQIISLSAKPMLVTLPVLLLILDVGPLQRLTRDDWRTRVWEKRLLIVISAAFCLIAIAAQQSGGALRTIEHHSLLQRAANAGQAYLVYLGQTAWPARLACYYPLREPAYGGAAAAIIVALTIALVWNFRRAPLVAAGWLWYVVALLPVIGLVQVGGQAHADRYTYLPHLGLFAALGVAAARTPLRRFPRLCAATVAIVVVACGLQTARQVATWRDSETLFTHCLAVTGEQALPHFNLGLHCAAHERPVDAENHYRLAIELQSDYPKAHNNLGLLLRQRGDLPGAIDEFRIAVAQQPGFFRALMNLGQAMEQTGRPAEATEALRQAVELEPDDPRAQMIFGRLLGQAGEWTDAEHRLRRALELAPLDPEPLVYLGIIKVRQGDVVEGRRLFEQARDTAGDNEAVRRYAIGQLQQL